MGKRVVGSDARQAAAAMRYAFGDEKALYYLFLAVKKKKKDKINNLPLPSGTVGSNRERNEAHRRVQRPSHPRCSHNPGAHRLGMP